ncbi:MAG: GNAT family N-acetyltransferase [Chitinophagales bacterium]
MTWERDGFLITTEENKMDIVYIHEFLSTKSYWAEGVPFRIVEKSIRGSLCFGLFKGKQQIGFARAITDKATFAWLADVFIDEQFRGHGLGKWLMEIIVSHNDLQGLRRIMLGTKDAHGLYAQYGFVSLPYPERMMTIHHPDVYMKKN